MFPDLILWILHRCAHVSGKQWHAFFISVLKVLGVLETFEPSHWKMPCKLWPRAVMCWYRITMLNHTEKQHPAQRNSDLFPSLDSHSPCFSVRFHQLKGAIVHYYAKLFRTFMQGEKQIHRPKLGLLVRKEYGILSKQWLDWSLKRMLQMWSLKRPMGITEES